KMQSCLEKCSLQSDIMRMNVDKVLERDQKLSELDNRADALQAGASQFETKSIHCRHYFHLHLIGFCLQHGISKWSLLVKGERDALPSSQSLPSSHSSSPS
uniref:V-SNARE coiled-coil homology domain-containing protein n=1 Tax=Calidris pygmaea TaxID=425635 RepID=A0A8C3JKI7_9CHAR